MPVHKSDNELIDHIANREIWALEALIEKYKDYVYNIALKITASREMAEEVVQDSFLKVYQYAGRFRKKARFSTWLYRIAYTTAVATADKQSKVAIGDKLNGNIDLPETDMLPVSMYDTEYLKKEIDTAIKQLPAAFALVLTLYYLHEQSVDEICIITGETRETIKVRLFRARKKLKDLLGHLKF
jgi:RNA polymerase sigma-70 factor (ECF subfamily)